MLATVLGTAIGIARLSKNFLVERLASGYVELIRNVPLLLQLLFWYNAVLKALPDFANGFAIPGGVLLNNRGLYMPRPLGSRRLARRRRARARGRARLTPSTRWPARSAGAWRIARPAVSRRRC